MTSLLTNRSAMAAVSALGMTERALSTTQREMTTGRRVSSATDNAAYWSIATSMNTRVGNLRAANDDLDLTSAIVATTNTALTTILGMVQKMSDLVVSAQTSGVDVSAVQSQIAALQKGIVTAADAATVNGVNWLVTKVVGTSTATETSSSDLGDAADQAIRAHGGDGIDHVTVLDGVDLHAVRTLGSTSASDAYYTTSTVYTFVGQTVSHTVGGTTTFVHSLTSTAANPTSTTSSAGDTTGYQTGQIPTSVAADGTVTFLSQDFHNTELFQSFSGNYTDASNPNSPGHVQEPYFTGTEHDILDTPFGTSAGQTNILKMVLANAQDAASAAPAIATAIDGITKGLTVLGGLQTQIDGSKSINTAIIGALTSGVGALVDADMDDVSTRQSALETQQRLSLQALSIANDNASVVLKLFQTPG